MSKKKKHEEHENHERWLVSYADFITLLFAFFTSMYAMSSVNEGKFRVLSESLAIAFNPTLLTTAKVQRGPKLIREQKPQSASEFSEIFNNNYSKLADALKDLEKSSKLALVVDEHRIVIRISESMLFEGGGDVITQQGKDILDEVGAVLKTLPSNVRVEGHTDNVPINTDKFPTNWDLSTARALKILKFFYAVQKMDPHRLSALGYGEYKPLDTNDTPAGRLRNRRIDIMLIDNEILRPI